jgi:hypothetical protein
VNGALPSSIEIDELSLSANMKEEDRVKRNDKIWKGADDGSQLSFNTRPNDIDGLKGIALEPQRIRTFLIAYN